MAEVRAFVAVYPPPPVVDALRALPRDPAWRWVPDDQLHVTMRFLGDGVDTDAVDEAMQAEFAHPPVDVHAGPAVDHFGRRVVHVPVAGLATVAAAIDAIVDGLVGPRDLPFVGHLTLGRARRRTGDVPLVGTPFEMSWPVDAVELVASELGALGANHRRVGRYQLSADS